MTRKRALSDVRNAWRSLYGEGGRDLTSEGFKEALKRLRRKDPAWAKRVERLLAPDLENIFPRRKRRFSKTSQGIKARLALLPGNPHVEIDIGTIREVLGIPEGDVKVRKGDEAWEDLKDLVEPDKIQRVAEGNLASAWLSGHRQAAMEKPIEWNDVLPLKMRQSAVRSARVDLGTSDVPEWLRQPLASSEAYSGSPMDHAATRLTLRHGLPHHTRTALTFYILTEDPSWVTNLEPFEIRINFNDNTPTSLDSLIVSVANIDEYATEEDWERIWRRYVRPRQEYFWGLRGMKPQGRRSVEIKRLREGLPVYRKMVLDGCRITDLLRDPVGNLTNWDQETIRDVISDLKELLEPGIR